MVNNFYTLVKNYNKRIKELSDQKLKIATEYLQYVNDHEKTFNEENKFVCMIYKITIQVIQMEINVVMENRPRLKILKKGIEKCHTMN
jgi:hypothetical protein